MIVCEDLVQLVIALLVVVAAAAAARVRVRVGKIQDLADVNPLRLI